MQAESSLLHENQKSKQAAHKVTAQQATTEAVGADNAGHAVSLKAQTRKRLAENEAPAAEAALDTQASELQPAVVESRVQDGQEEQDSQPTLEQRVQALQLQQRPAGVALTTPVLALLNQPMCTEAVQQLVINSQAGWFGLLHMYPTRMLVQRDSAEVAETSKF